MNIILKYAYKLKFRTFNENKRNLIWFQLIPISNSIRILVRDEHLNKTFLNWALAAGKSRLLTSTSHAVRGFVYYFNVAVCTSHYIVVVQFIGLRRVVIGNLINLIKSIVFIPACGHVQQTWLIDNIHVFSLSACILYASRPKLNFWAFSYKYMHDKVSGETVIKFWNA